MQLARFLVEAVVLGKQSPNQLAREYAISRSWLYELLARYRRDGPGALEPSSHRPTSCPHQTDASVVVAVPTVKAADAVECFYLAAEEFGLPARFLSDNAAVFSGKSRRGRVALESELDRLGVQCVHSTPYHPQTCGKVERFHQTLKLFLAKQAPPESLAHLQLQLDAFRTIYNQQRPHRALDGRTPLQAFHARLKASPSLAQPPLDYRIRRDRLDAGGRVTLRYLSRLRHFHVSYKHRGQPVMLLVAGAHVRVIAEDGQLLRELTLDPSRDYQPSTSHTLVRHQVGQRSAST